MKKIAACAVMTLLGSTSVFRGLAAHARAAEPAEQQWSELCLTTQQFPKNSARPFAIALASLTSCDRAGVQMPVPAPGGKVTPSLTEPRE